MSPFKGSNRARMGSSVLTNRPQGGGNKKAGFPYMVGRGYMTPNYLQYKNSRSLPVLQMNMFPNARPSRPIGSTNAANYRYYHIPGTK
jgi:hypothetical protein